jgi:hypothetical protein
VTWIHPHGVTLIGSATYYDSNDVIVNANENVYANVTVNCDWSFENGHDHYETNHCRVDP